MLLFFIIALAGLALLAVSVVFGELFDFLNLDLGDGLDLGADGGGPITTPIIAFALTAFGATGMLTQYAGWGVVTSVGTSLVAAAAFGALGGWLATMIYRQTSGTEDAFSHVRGRLGEVTTAITDTPGEVQISSYGSTHTRLARSVSGETIPRGVIVRIVDVMGNTLIVERASEQAESVDGTRVEA